MTNSKTNSEELRLALQAELDAAKSQPERNRMGQFATPTGLAVDMLRYAKTSLRKPEKIRFLDPAIGTGSFYSALLSVFAKSQIDLAVGYEIDPHYAMPAKNLWAGSCLEMHLSDFTAAQAPAEDEKFNLLICNPPYVRHHHIVNGDKQRLKTRARDACGVEINGLAGLYCYFLCLSHAWITEDGLAGWLIPSEFMDVNYGSAVKHYLLDKVTLMHIHRFDPNDVQFGDALVSSAVVWFHKALPPKNHSVRFTFGGSLQKPKLDRLVPVEAIRRDRKWTGYPVKGCCAVEGLSKLGDFFIIKRGLATGNNSYFILTDKYIAKRELPMGTFRPILPSPRYLPVDEIQADGKGNPLLEKKLFLLDCRLPEDEVEARYPSLWAYLEEGKTEGITDRYLCRHRSPWYKQENRPSAPFVCTYMGRSNKRNGRPFRFILNNSKATAANVYLMLYPKPVIDRVLQANPELRKKVWFLLNEIGNEAMLSEGRVYGGGLHKIEPKELAQVSAIEIAKLFQDFMVPQASKQLSLF